MKKNNIFKYCFIFLFISCQNNTFESPGDFIGKTIKECNFDDSEYYFGIQNNSEGREKELLFAFSERNRVLILKASSVTSHINGYYYSPYINFNNTKEYIGYNIDMVIDSLGKPFLVRHYINNLFIFYFQESKKISIFKKEISNEVICFEFDENKKLKNVTEIYWTRP